MNEQIIDLIYTCYNDELKRDPDQSGIETYYELIKNGKCDENSLRNILRESSEFKNLKFDYSLKKCNLNHFHYCIDIRVQNIEQIYEWIFNNYDTINSKQKYFFIIDNHKLRMKVIDTFINNLGDFINFNDEQVYIKGERILRYPKEFYFTPQDTIRLTIPNNNTPPMVVISRYNENIDWSYALSKVIIYNKGENDIHSNFPIIPLTNIGREGHTYLHYIIDQYEYLPNYIIFSQANPFEHSPDFITLVKDNYHLLDDYQGLTWRWKDRDPTIDWLNSINSQGIPPIDSRKMTECFHINGCKIHYEILDRNFNCVCPVIWEDGGFNTHLIPRTRKRLEIPDDITLLEYLFDRLEIKEKCPEYFPFNFSAIFGVRKENILKHPILVYHNLMVFLLEHPDHGYLLERMWGLLFS